MATYKFDSLTVLQTSANACSWFGFGAVIGMQPVDADIVVVVTLMQVLTEGMMGMVAVGAVVTVAATI
jgi:hypothetical protein